MGAYSFSVSAICVNLLWVCMCGEIDLNSKIHVFVYTCEGYFRRHYLNNTIPNRVMKEIRNNCPMVTSVELQDSTVIKGRCEVHIQVYPKWKFLFYYEPCAKAIYDVSQNAAEDIYGSIFSCPAVELQVKRTDYYYVGVPVAELPNMNISRMSSAQCIEPALGINETVELECRMNEFGGYNWRIFETEKWNISYLENMTLTKLSVLSEQGYNCSVIIIAIFAVETCSETSLSVPALQKEICRRISLQNFCPTLKPAEIKASIKNLLRLLDDNYFAVVSHLKSEQTTGNWDPLDEIGRTMKLYSNYFFSICTNGRDFQYHSKCCSIRCVTQRDSTRRYDDRGNMAVTLPIGTARVLIMSAPYSHIKLNRTETSVKVATGLTYLLSDTAEIFPIAVEFVIHALGKRHHYECGWGEPGLADNRGKIMVNSKAAEKVDNASSNIKCMFSRSGLYAALEIFNPLGGIPYHDTPFMIKCHVFVICLCVLGAIYNLHLICWPKASTVYAAEGRSVKHMKSFRMLAAEMLLVCAGKLLVQAIALRLGRHGVNCPVTGSLVVALNGAFHWLSLLSAAMVFAVGRTHDPVQLAARACISTYVVGFIYGSTVGSLHTDAFILRSCMPVSMFRTMVYPMLSISFISIIFLILFVVLPPRRNWDEWVGAVLISLSSVTPWIGYLRNRSLVLKGEYDDYTFIVLSLLQGLFLTSYHCILKWGAVQFFVKIYNENCRSKPRKLAPELAQGDRGGEDATSDEEDDTSFVAQLLEEEEKRYRKSVAASSFHSDWTGDTQPAYKSVYFRQVPAGSLDERSAQSVEVFSNDSEMIPHDRRSLMSLMHSRVSSEPRLSSQTMQSIETLKTYATRRSSRRFGSVSTVGSLRSGRRSRRSMTSFRSLRGRRSVRS
ncbi:unnamed protein product [Calicophoron daubneyi]|uniref:Intimal thickness related receptor IRP domain-containing protein n=1 Tax=Calicophoron daubneyi TaxID=300641 RepID=A0AAV2TK69_CALDB